MGTQPPTDEGKEPVLPEEESPVEQDEIKKARMEAKEEWCERNPDKEPEEWNLLDEDVRSVYMYERVRKTRRSNARSRTPPGGRK